MTTFYIQVRDGARWKTLDTHSDPEQASLIGMELHKQSPHRSFRVMYDGSTADFHRKGEHIYWRTL